MTDDLRQRVLADSSVPEPLRRALEKGLPLEEIRLDNHGQWWHRGARIDHPRIRALFSRSVDATDGGTWVLRIGRFTYPIVVDDTPYFVESAVADDERGHVWLTLTDGSRERLDTSTIRLQGDGRLLATVKGGRFEARFLRRAYHDLAEHLEEDQDSYVLVIGGRRVPL